MNNVEIRKRNPVTIYSGKKKEIINNENIDFDSKNNEPDLLSSLDHKHFKKSKLNIITRITETQQLQQSENGEKNWKENKMNEKFINDINENDQSEDKIEIEKNHENNDFTIKISIDLVSCMLFILAFLTRTYRLTTPNNIVFDELHYGKSISLYMRNIFYFDHQPPFGKQLIAGAAYLCGFNGNYTFTKIGAEYGTNVPIFWLRFIPALCGSLLTTTVYEILKEMKINRFISLLGGILIILDNSLLTQSRFILMEPILLFFAFNGILFLLKFQKTQIGTTKWIIYALLSTISITFAVSIKYAGFYTYCLALFIICRYLWELLNEQTVSDLQLILHVIVRSVIFIVIPIAVYLMIFYVHLNILHKAGPHDSVMTSAFQASLDGGLASITKGQPVTVIHGSQITLRHTHGRMCWLHSHNHLYPVRYPDKRGSSHQQQVTCYSFKDVNNWWIVKRPERDELVVDDVDPIKDGDIIQLVHGISSRGLNSHDVAAPVTPNCQEVSCYIDYNVSMPGQLLWKLEIANKDTEGPIWHAIRSEIRLIHVNTNAILKFTKKQLPEWGFNQHEIVADRDSSAGQNLDTIWNVEEHRYTMTTDQKERERELLKFEMLPTQRTFLSFWEKFLELQSKMLLFEDPMTSHMYSSEVYEWPLLNKGIAYWVDSTSNGQIYLLGNISIWYSGTISILIYCTILIFYLIRRQRFCYDLPDVEWNRFVRCGEIFLGGYLIHYLPYFFVDRTLFLNSYLPAFVFKLLLLCFVIDHIDVLVRKFSRFYLSIIYRCIVIIWLFGNIYVFRKFLAISYGIDKLTTDDVMNLRWKDTWDFILH